MFPQVKITVMAPSSDKSAPAIIPAAVDFSQ
jgi:hypothetical protein